MCSYAASDDSDHRDDDKLQARSLLLWVVEVDLLLRALEGGSFFISLMFVFISLEGEI